QDRRKTYPVNPNKQVNQAKSFFLDFIFLMINSILRELMITPSFKKVAAMVLKPRRKGILTQLLLYFSLIIIRPTFFSFLAHFLLSFLFNGLISMSWMVVSNELILIPSCFVVIFTFWPW